MGSEKERRGSGREGKVSKSMVAKLHQQSLWYHGDIPSVDALVNALEAVSVSAWRYAGLLNARHAYWTVEMLVNC